MKNVMEVAPAMAQGNWVQTHNTTPSGVFKAPDDARGCTVGVISASHVGRNLLKLLPAFDIKALLYDPFVTAEKAREMNAEKVELDAIFEHSDVVCCHAPSIPETHHMVNAARLAKMKKGAIFINNSRGTLVDEKALVDELKKRRIWAFLDVYDPEPPPSGSPLYGCPNLTMTPHIAGCVGRGRLRLGAQAFAELSSFFVGQPVRYPVTQKMLATIG
jgi:phosphoglycerate dehydrogenase-like enzyme